jgi:glycine betaine/proline transport system substrate-binding protein
MKIMKKFLMLAIVLMVAMAFLFVGCQQEEEAAEKEAEKEEQVDKTANLTYVNWAEGVAYTHLAKNILESKMGYDVEITAADVAPAYTAIAQGDMDAFMETWLPVLHKDYVEEYGDQVTDLGHVFEGTQSGWVIPQYMADDGVTAISDLRDEEVAKKLDYEITGIDAGAGVMVTSDEKTMPAYGLREFGYELVASSGPAMASALKKAIDNEEYIVVTGWKPHWKFARWDLTFLEQDEEVIWEKGNIHIMGRKNIKEDKPELAQFLSNMFFTTEEVGSLMLAVRESDADPIESTREWMEENQDVWQDWIPE